MLLTRLTKLGTDNASHVHTSVNTGLSLLLKTLAKKVGRHREGTPKT